MTTPIRITPEQYANPQSLPAPAWFYVPKTDAIGDTGWIHRGVKFPRNSVVLATHYSSDAPTAPTGKPDTLLGQEPIQADPATGCLDHAKASQPPVPSIITAPTVTPQEGEPEWRHHAHDGEFFLEYRHSMHGWVQAGVFFPQPGFSVDDFLQMVNRLKVQSAPPAPTKPEPGDEWAKRASETPRTDAVDRQAQSIVLQKSFGATTADTINEIVELYSEHAHRLERSLNPAYACNADLGRRIGELQEQIKQLKKNEAICHCGEAVSAHHMGSGHSPVELPESCPYAEQLAPLQAEVEKLRAELCRVELDWQELNRQCDQARKEVERLKCEAEELGRQNIQLLGNYAGGTRLDMIADWCDRRLVQEGREDELKSPTCHGAIIRGTMGYVTQLENQLNDIKRDRDYIADAWATKCDKLETRLAQLEQQVGELHAIVEKQDIDPNFDGNWRNGFYQCRSQILEAFSMLTTRNKYPHEKT